MFFRNLRYRNAPRGWWHVNAREGQEPDFVSRAPHGVTRAPSQAELSCDRRSVRAIEAAISNVA